MSYDPCDLLCQLLQGDFAMKKLILEAIFGQTTKKCQIFGL